MLFFFCTKPDCNVRMFTVTNAQELQQLKVELKPTNFFHRYTTKVKSNRDQVRDPRQFSVSKKQAMCWPAWTPLPSWGRWMMHTRLAANRKSLPVIFCLHKGHVRFSISQESTHLQWNSCAHGKMRTLWGREKDQYQTDHWRGRIVIITRLN